MGKTIFMPENGEQAMIQLSELSRISSTIEWERAALIALLVESKGKGRPKFGTKSDKYSISEFSRLGIYGFRSANTIAAYLKIWRMSGLPVPCFGHKVSLPDIPFPDMGEVYERLFRSKEDREFERAIYDIEEAITSKRTVVYRYYNKSDELLYIGKTKDPVIRMGKHQRRSWFIDIACIKFDWYPDPDSAREAETKAIAEENPRYNKNR